jgi:hypothetical protein
MSGNFNSGDFADVSSSVFHARTNPMVVSNGKMKILWKGNFVMPEPHGIVDDLSPVLFADMDDFQVTRELRFRPEAISERIYGTPDLWYLILKANDFVRPTQVEVGSIKVVKPSLIGELLNRIVKSSRGIRTSESYPTEVKDRTLVDVGL